MNYQTKTVDSLSIYKKLLNMLCWYMTIVQPSRNIFMVIKLIVDGFHKINRISKLGGQVKQRITFCRLGITQIVNPNPDKKIEAVELFGMKNSIARWMIAGLTLGDAVIDIKSKISQKKIYCLEFLTVGMVRRKLTTY